MVAGDGLVGRVHECEQIRAALTAGQNVLVKGRAGVGKSAALEAVAEQVGDELTVVHVPFIAAKQAMLETAKQLHEKVGLILPASALPPRVASRARLGHALTWDDISRSIRREPLDQTVAHLERTLAKYRCLLVIGSLEIPLTFANALNQLADHTQLLAAIDDTNRRVRIVKFLWRFNTTVELKPLSLNDSEQLIDNECKRHSPRFADHRTQRLFVRHVAQQSNGVPAAIMGMLDSALSEDRITPAKVRGYSHDAGVRYLDMTPMLVSVLVVAMAARYIGRGIGEMELMVLSGVSTAVFMGLRYFLMVMRR